MIDNYCGSISGTFKILIYSIMNSDLPPLFICINTFDTLKLFCAQVHL